MFLSSCKDGASLALGHVLLCAYAVIWRDVLLCLQVAELADGDQANCQHLAEVPD